MLNSKYQCCQWMKHDCSYFLKNVKQQEKYVYTSLNPVSNAHVCVYLTVHITKLQLQIDENINIVIEFNPYLPKFSK